MRQLMFLNPAQAAEKIANSPITVLDIRESAAFAQGHITEARNISANQLAEFCQHTAKTTPILVCCYHGISSQTVGHYLLQQGFEEIYSLQGGFSAWQQWQANNPIKAQMSEG